MDRIPRRHPTDPASLRRESDVTFFKATGPGGQHRNKRETGVRLVHRPSGVVVTAVERRSQAQNLSEAYRRLAVKLRALNHVPKKRQRTQIPGVEIRKRLEAKIRRGEKKTLRKSPPVDGE